MTFILRLPQALASIARRSLVGALACTLATLSHQALADSFPSKPVRMVVPFSAGGTMDTFGRLVAAEMSKALGQTVIIENIPGAGGVLATDNVARSSADGYSMCFCATGSTVILPLMNKSLPYKTSDDVPPIGHVLRIEQTILVNAKRGPTTLAALIARAKANPGGMFYGTPGNGTSNHLAGELLKIDAGIDVTTLHYRGESAALPDLMTGRIDYMVASVSFAEPYVKSGDLRVLALTGPRRLANFPNLPTVAESGYPGFEATTHVGLHAPRGTSAERIQVLNAAMNKALQSEELRARMAANGVTPLGGTAAEYARFLEEERAKWGKLIQQANIHLD
jgi:tripartite-type tricarboxylate transporter receptor subunit TctC